MPAAAEYLTVDDVAAALRISKSQVAAHILAGRLPASDVGTGRRHHWRVHPEDLETFLAARRPEPKGTPRKKAKAANRVREYFP